MRLHEGRTDNAGCRSGKSTSVRSSGQFHFSEEHYAEMSEQYTPLLQRPRTYFIDIDGTILEQSDKWESGKVADPRNYKELPGSVRLINKWYTDGHRIVLTTSRAEPYRARTAHQLENIGLEYHDLIMSLPTGQRILINDRKPQESLDTAIAVNLVRDAGLGTIEIDYGRAA